VASINFGLDPREGDETLKDRDLPSEDAEYFECRAEGTAFAGLGDGLGAGGKQCKTPQQILNGTHANLLRLATARQTILEATSGLGLRIAVETKGRKAKYFIEYFDPQTGRLAEVEQSVGLPWGLLPPSAAKRVGLLTWTSKMGTPSFSLPAGPAASGGACPSAAGGQSIEEPRAREIFGKRVLQVLAERAPPAATPLPATVELSTAVCEHCYATTGNYSMYAAMVMQQLITFAWTKAALEHGDFVPIMIDAINRTDYKLKHEPAKWLATGWRFFRVHDSGDFFSKEYFRAWKAITDAFASDNPYGHAPIMFWAPTRMWAMPGWIEFVNEANGGANSKGNFVIRPSAYSLDQHAPDVKGGGWAAGSTVFAPSAADRVVACEVPPTFDWDCQAYAVKNGPTCRGAADPTGATGCRACWAAADAVVNYRAH